MIPGPQLRNHELVGWMPTHPRGRVPVWRYMKHYRKAAQDPYFHRPTGSR